MWLHFVTIPTNWLETGKSFWRKTHPLPQSSSWANSAVSTPDFQRVVMTYCDSIHSSASTHHLPSPPSNANGDFSPRRRTRCQPADTGPARGAGWAGDNFPRSQITSWICCQVSFTGRNPILGAVWPLSSAIPRTFLEKAVTASRNWGTVIPRSSTSLFSPGCGVSLTWMSCIWCHPSQPAAHRWDSCAPSTAPGTSDMSPEEDNKH